MSSVSNPTSTPAAHTSTPATSPGAPAAIPLGISTTNSSISCSAGNSSITLAVQPTSRSFFDRLGYILHTKAPSVTPLLSYLRGETDEAVTNSFVVQVQEFIEWVRNQAVDYPLKAAVVIAVEDRKIAGYSQTLLDLKPESVNTLNEFCNQALEGFEEILRRQNLNRYSKVGLCAMFVNSREETLRDDSVVSLLALNKDVTTSNPNNSFGKTLIKKVSARGVFDLFNTFFAGHPDNEKLRKEVLTYFARKSPENPGWLFTDPLPAAAPE